MIVSELTEATLDFAKDLNSRSQFNIEIGQQFEAPGPISNPQNANLRANGLDSCSGLYFLSLEDGTALYIGKATTDNLHPELWGKLRTPAGIEPHLEYPETYWAERTDLPEELHLSIRSGEILVSAIVIRPNWITSLFEVYLHSLCMAVDDCLPALNSRIG